jgi:hypothetical protein
MILLLVLVVTVRLLVTAEVSEEDLAVMLEEDLWE